MREVRIGVAGAGALGYHHIRLLRDIAGVRCAGFHDTSATRSAQVAAELGVIAHATLDALLEASDAVCVVVPTTAHATVGLSAIARGKHLLIEKPLCVTVAEADALLDAARSAGVVVQTGHVERFNRAVRAALPYVDRPRFISSERLAPFNLRGTDVAVVLDLMIHDIDLVQTLVGSAVTEVRAVGVPILTPSLDIANARLEFADGAVALITASRVSRERMRKLRIFQRSGYLSLDLAAGTGEFYRVRADANPLEMVGGPSLAGLVEVVPLVAPEGEPLRLELEAFADAVRGVAAPPVTGEDGRTALATAIRILESISTSRATSLAADATAAARPPRA